MIKADSRDIARMGLIGIPEPTAAAVAERMRDWYHDTRIVYENSILCSGVIGLRPRYNDVTGRWGLIDHSGQTYSMDAKGLRVIEGKARLPWRCQETGREDYITLEAMDELFRIFFEVRNDLVDAVFTADRANDERLLGKPAPAEGPVCRWCNQPIPVGRQQSPSHSSEGRAYCSDGCWETACEEAKDYDGGAR